jgi:quinol monooxygenase YgiN
MTGGGMMYISRLLFHAIPGKTGEVEKELRTLGEMVKSSHDAKCRILHTHFASYGAPDSVFEQEASDIAALERHIGELTRTAEFQRWSNNVSNLLTQSPKRELYIVSETN